MAQTPPDAHLQQLANVEELLEHFELIEQRFEHMQQGLAESHRLATLGTIAAMVAHEFNNLLTPVMSYAQLALASPDDKALMHKAVEKALAASEKAAHITRSMLDFARGPEDHRISECDGPPRANLLQVVEDALACLAREPEKDGIDLQLRIDPAFIVGMHPTHLQQVMVNLILNARQAMRSRQGAKRLTITATSARQRCYVDVADTGPGIDANMLDRIFEPFVTFADANGTAPSPHSGCSNSGKTGSGLGLSICRDLVRQIGGQISASSTPAQGATFHLELPLVQRDDPVYEST